MNIIYKLIFLIFLINVHEDALIYLFIIRKTYYLPALITSVLLYLRVIINA